MFAQWKLWNILKLYKAWFKEIFKESVKLEWHNDFCCIPEYPYQIWIGMTMTEENIITLPQFLQENFHCKFSMENITIWCLCWLHECGHIATDIEFSEEDKKYDKETISISDYRKLPHEWAADEWAIDYINNNGVTVHKWQHKIQKAYSKVTQKDLEKFTKRNK